MKIITETAKEIMERLKESAREKESYGPDFNVSESSDWYREMYPIALLERNRQEQLQAMNDNRDLSKAEEPWFWLEASNFLFFRKMPTTSIATIETKDSSIGATARKGEIKLRKKGTDVIYTNIENLTINSNPFTFIVESFDTGAITNAEIGEITEIVSIPENFGTFKNITSAEGGQDLETLEEGRKRFFNGANANTAWNKDGIESALANLRGVTSVKVIVNNTDNIIKGQNRRSVHCVVEGGIEEEILKIIYLKVLPATYYFGSIRKNVKAANGELIEVAFDRPTEIKVDVKVEVLGESNVTEAKNSVINYMKTVGVGNVVSSSSAIEYMKNNFPTSKNYKNIDVFFKKQDTSNWVSHIALGNTEKAVYSNI